jgi:hypothetical protein
MIKHHGVIPLIHPIQYAAQVIYTIRHLGQKVCDERVFGFRGYVVVAVGDVDCVDGVEHKADHFGAAGFDGDGDDEKPALVVGAGERVDGVDVVGVGQVYWFVVVGAVCDGGEVP